MNLTLVRHAYLRDCTLGRLYVGDQVFATLEEPWSADPDGPGGQRRQEGLRESCVPDGQYALVPHNGAKWTNVWALVNPALGVFRQPGDIPLNAKYGRAAILLGHPGTTVRDIEGCILSGLTSGKFEGLDAVFETRKALERLRAELGNVLTHLLQIRPIAGTAEIAA